jgi:hypothetical protein
LLHLHFFRSKTSPAIFQTTNSEIAQGSVDRVSAEDLEKLLVLESGRKMDRRTLNKLRRAAGMDYVSRKKNKDGTLVHVKKSARTMQPACNSTRRCHNSKEFHCSAFSKEERQRIFDSIWATCSNWETKRNMVINLVQRLPRRNHHQAHAMNKYFLPNVDGTSKVYSVFQFGNLECNFNI